jgi:hypothetical protein
VAQCFQNGGSSAGLATHLENARKSCSSDHPSITVLEGLFDIALEGNKETHIIIDALDECPDTIECRPQVFQALSKLAHTYKLNFLVSSRKEADIENFVQNCRLHQSTYKLKT